MADRTENGDRSGGPDGDPGDTPGEELPVDLISAGYVGPYVFPNNNRRRIPGGIYLVVGLAAIAVWATADTDAVLINGGILAAGIALVVIGGYHLLTGWTLKLDEKDALVEATRAVGFPVGHASAQMGWRGLLSRPTWRVLLYSADDPPSKRGLVLIDGATSEVLDQIVEDTPEDWSQYE